MLETPTAADTIIRLYRAYPQAFSPMRADKSALGILPTLAYRYCEPIRTASGYGWYFFPPTDIALQWDGTEILFYNGDEGSWQKLNSAFLSDFDEYWQQHAPEDLKRSPPPYMTALPISGYVQIWSGYMCATKPEWAIHVRPLANLNPSRHFTCFEGIVESDRFQPCPLFINIKLMSTDKIIEIPKVQPLFQLQALPRQAYAEASHSIVEHIGLDAKQGAQQVFDHELWGAFRKTVRIDQPGDIPQTGHYSRDTRIRSKSEQ